MTNTASVLLEAELTLALYFLITVETSMASGVKACYGLSFQKADKGVGKKTRASQSSRKWEPEMLMSGGIA